MRVLLVEDDPMIGDAMHAALKDAAYAADWVRNGRTALDALVGQHYDLVLLDLGLPGKDGLEVLGAIRARADPVPLLIVTARDGLDDRLRGLDGGLRRLHGLRRRPGRVLGAREHEAVALPVALVVAPARAALLLLGFGQKPDRNDHQRCPEGATSTSKPVAWVQVEAAGTIRRGLWNRAVFRTGAKPSVLTAFTACSV